MKIGDMGDDEVSSELNRRLLTRERRRATAYKIAALLFVAFFVLWVPVLWRS
jgi:predicted nucleic acid-binding Zn ribbon protein